MTNLEFRNAVLAALSGVLGEYRDSKTGNVVGPAINLGQRVTPGLAVVGVEAVILPTPELDPLREFGGTVAVARRRTLILKQWTEDASLEPAMQRITISFPTSEPVSVMPATTETLAQVSYEIYETEDIANG